MKILPVAALALGACALGACASRPSGPPARPVSIDQSALLLKAARETRDKEGCVAAAPSLRVAAAMGEGKEAAQHELGECLIAMTGASETETRLLHEEGRFWLTRAAYAGNARAQRFLAVEAGGHGTSDSERADALKWALVYGRNAEADLYGYKALPATFVPGLRGALSADAVAEAEAFAKSFTPIPLAAFVPPKISGGADRDGQRGPGGPGGPPPDGERRRPR